MTLRGLPKLHPSIAAAMTAMAGQGGFSDTDERLKRLSAAGDPLERLAAVVDFEPFRPELDGALGRSDRAKGGRPPCDAVMMFRVLVLQPLYALSDDQTEHQLRDRLSFMGFAGLALHDAVRDAKTIWLYREPLVRAGGFERLIEAEEQRLVQPLVPHPAVEGLANAVLHRLFGSDEKPGDAGRLGSLAHGVRDELRAVVSDDQVRLATAGDDRSRLPHDPLARDRGVDRPADAWRGDRQDRLPDPYGVSAARPVGGLM